ncbi:MULTISPECIES: flagellar hook-associated protein FlgK [unclassified Rhizobacter]|uniref:flagellar hook-associated protein FlgK n=1 Tax=unclassified Rhizobacter TaxID=2640088 RepID=UPI0007011324|nr:MULTISPECIES: flagellar hook-associated protein FlgK [unclassified Rhizobacter]KQU71320.1 flagellar hook protein [Rhizobacter sp. Root29]KQW10634.1 flagellar hook protein [Rhizobacter sp. Root1238]KRB24710.1 flagellar hook protein [Rhizobacter sp. Root16D2]
MSSSALLGIGTRAMFANYAALQATGNNIANANTEGYSRQQVVLETAKGQFTGAGFFGKGVNVSSVIRSYNSFLTTQASATKATAAGDAARAEQLKQIESVFGTGKSGVGYSAGELLNAFVDVANQPADSSARQVVIARAKELANKFAAAGDQLQSIQTGVTQDIKSSVDTVNSLAQQVGKLNEQIQALNGTGQPPNDLLDKRDTLISQISGYIGVTTIKADNGSIGVFVGGGQALVLGANANKLTTVPDAYDPSKVQLGISVGSGLSSMIPQDALSDGSISGMLRFQNDDLVDARNLLGQMAAAISGAVNQQQSLGLDMGKPANFGSPLYAVGAPRSLPAASNAGDAVFGVTLTDTTQVQASDYELQFDGTNYSLTRLSDNTAAVGSPFSAAQMAAGITVDGMTIQMTAGASVAGDRTLLQPVGNAAKDMRAVLSDPNGIAAASPVTSTFAATNKGTATLASLAAVSNSLDRTLTANVSFTSDTGDYNWELLDSTGAQVSAGTGTWTAGSPIALNGFELKLNGVPKTGDTVAVKPTTSTEANNGNALAFVGIGTKGIVGGSTLANGTVTPGKTITDAYASALSDIGVRVQSAQTAASISDSAATQAESARANKSGVNLDEEAAKLIQYQQSYQAAAKMLQVAQQVFDTLLQTAAG